MDTEMRTVFKPRRVVDGQAQLPERSHASPLDRKGCGGLPYSRRVRRFHRSDRRGKVSYEPTAASEVDFAQHPRTKASCSDLFPLLLPSGNGRKGARAAAPNTRRRVRNGTVSR